MIRLLINISLRQFRKHTTYNTINLLGLAVGMASFMFIAIYLLHEFSFERLHQNVDNIYRFTFKNGSKKQFAISPSALQIYAKQEIPEIQQSVRIWRRYSGLSNVLMVHGDRAHYEQNVIYADSTFSKVFTVDILDGNFQSAMKGKDGVLISYAIARKYFGEESAVGQTIRMNNERDLFVMGVFRDFANSHLKIDFLLPFHSQPTEDNIWQFWNVNTYFLLRPDSNPEIVAKKMSGIFTRHAGTLSDQWKDFEYILQPLSQIHFTADILFDAVNPTSKFKLWIIGAIALVLLGMSVINFINLITVKLVERGKEIAVNRLLGANGAALKRQHISESILLSLASAVVAYVLFLLLLPFFQNLVGIEIALTFGLKSKIVASLVLLSILIGVISGVVPSGLIRKFTPATTLKNNRSAAAESTPLRQILVVVQFVASILLLTITGVIYKQVRFMENKDLGFQKDDVLILRLRNFDQKEFRALKNSLLQHSAIEKAGGSQRPIGSTFGMWGFLTSEMEPGDSRGIVNFIIIDHDFIDAMKLTMVDGRPFSEEIGSDSIDSFLINETAAKWFSLKSPIGASLSTQEIQGKVVGVVKDFNFGSLEKVVAPLVLSLRSLNVNAPPGNPYQYLALRIKPGQIAHAIKIIKNEWAALRPDFPLEYYFQDEYLNQLYAHQEQFKKIITSFTVIAFAIGSFGLFSFTSYLCKKRRKEVGIRKVLGGSSWQLVLVLSANAMKLICISLLIAFPLALYSIDIWLSSFAYRVEVSPMYFVLIALTTFLVGWIAVSYEAIKTSLVNPTEILKEE